MKYFRFLILVLSLFFVSQSLYSQTTDSSFKSGSWNDPTTWRSGIVPTSNTNVVVLRTDTVTVPYNATVQCRDLQVNGTTGTRVQFDSGAVLEVLGTISSDSTFISVYAINNNTGKNSKTVLKRETNGPLFGVKWSAGTPYLRLEVNLPDSVTGTSSTDIKLMGLRMIRGTWDLQGKDLRPDSTGNVTGSGHMFIGSGATVKGVRMIMRTSGTPSAVCSTLTIAGTLDIDSTISMRVVRMRKGGVLRTKAFNIFFVNPITVDFTSANAQGGVIEYARNGEQNIYVGSTGVTYSGIKLSGTGLKNSGTGLVINDSLIYSTTSTINGTFTRGTNMWLVYGGTTPRITSTELLTTTKNLKINNASGVSIDKNLTIQSNLWLQSGTLTTSTFAVSILSGATITRTKGIITGSNLTIPSDITVMYNNTDSLGFHNEISSNSIQKLVLASGSVVSFTKNLTVTNVCSLYSGRLKPLGFSLTIPFTASIASSGGYVDGGISIGISEPRTYVFPIGSGSSYTPVKLLMQNIDGNGTITANVITQTHPSAQFRDSTVRRYWSLTQTGPLIGFTTNLELTYADADLFSNADENSLLVGKWSGTQPWNIFQNTTRNPATNTVGITGISSFSEFAIGKNIPAFIGYPTAKIIGKKFNDLTANGIQDINDPGIAGWKVKAIGVLSSDSAFTDASGNYTLDSLYAGTYIVSEGTVPTWTQSFPVSPSSYSVALTMDTIITEINFGNYQLGTILGTKWNDVNGDGIKNVDEPGLPNWQINISGAKDTSALTDENGNYIFQYIPLGDYLVNENVQSGWIQTYPGGSGSFALNLVSAEIENNINFGNFQLGTISGLKFEDTNGNGIKDESEPALPNWTIRLSKSGMQVDSAVTNNAGGYSFQNLEPGIYTITEALQSGWAQTLPLSGTYRDTIFTGSNLTGRNFGNFKLGIISGIKFNDLNQNGIRDNGENGLANWKIRISGTRTDSNFTDGSGGFSFENLGVGTYVVSEVLQTGWIQTYPSNNGTYEFTTTSGSIFPNANFGNFQFGSVSGTVFNDFDGDGTKDAGELGVQNWKVKISGNRTDSILTTADGIYSFNQLTFGSYTVMQEVQNDWIQTLPVNNQPYSFIAQSGTILNNRDFGNFRLGSIAGMKFNDINGNGVKDVGETGMSNWLIRLNGAKTDSQLTDGNGVYQFNSLAGGTYSITEKLQSGWFQSIPASGSYSITMRSGLDTANVLFGNYLLGSISGFVFNDINSNGTFDSGENGIANWKLRISGTANETTMTDNGGNFTFPNLRIGNYTVTQILPSGWIQKFPASNGTYAVTISAGTISTGKNFGNFQLGIISGKIFNDINGNGIRESGEPGLENWKINLTGSATDSMMSDVDGNYIFDSLQLGSYQVSQTVQSGWIQSLPVSGGNYSVSVFSGTNASNRDFGNYQLGSISGIKFEDINGDGVKGTNEPVLSNWKIRLNGLRTDSMFTDGNGAYLFNNLAIGNYTVSEVLQNGWAQSLPPNGQYTLTVTSGLHLTNKNFGNYRYASLSGLKWNDINDNGIKDNGEPVLSGWKIYIAGPKNDSTTTNGSGHYSFQNLFVGTYSVSEQVQSGWVKTYPQGNHSITLRSGLDTSQVNFGNFQYGTISGKKWNDLDNDGILDNGETFLPNWKITLNGVRSETTLTNSNGEYSFGNLRGGNYSVGEISEIGWVQSFPSAGTHALSITSGTVHSSRNFGSHLLSSIQGTVYNDYNGNGMKDFGENPLSNRSIYLRGALNDTLMSDANGTFTFYYLTTANYTVSSQLPTGWIYTQPSDGDTTFNITQDGTIISNANIGMFQFGSIRGQVYNDLNSDGIRDSLDPFLSNWRIRIIGPKIDSVFSNGQGNYVFNNLPAGTYIISEALQSGWVHSAPPADTFSVKIFSGTNITQKDFGNFQLGEVRGKVFNDINADGVRDLNEPIVPNWKVYLSHNLLIVDSALTSDSGSYTFHNVFPNIYHISSEVRGDWKLTFPLSSFHTDTVKSGSILMENNFGIFQRGKISGAKFNDRNGNGIRDGGEPGIPNWKIYISGGVSDSLSTDGDGNYEFSLLDYGSYVMSEDMPAGWKRSYPPAPGIHLVSITSGANATGKIFGNYQFGTIGGTVYNDFNKNGVKDAGEEALQNRKVKITGVQNDSVFSNANGNFSFTNLELGNYTVTQVNPPQWQQTQPATNGYSVVINSGTNITGRNFGNFEPGKISGIIFEDANGNGIKDFGEPGLSQRKVLISGTKSDSLRTDANGFYHFTNLDTGQYVVSQPDSFGWSQSLPPNHGTYACYVQSSSNFIDRHFGNYRNASISGIKFNDLNANGNRESGEPPLANWKIYLVGPLPDSSRVDSALTNINGNYTFQNLAIGSYIVREERKTQWKQTFPANDASYFVVLQSGTSSSDKNFGNFKFVTISGMKFLDANGNHIRDENEPGLSGWKIRLQLGSQIIDSTNTNDEGSYTFRNISPSTYIVYEALQIGWLPTYPQNGVHIVTAMSGDSIVNTNFGNVRTNSISGLLFNDIDGDGLFDNGESTIENWKVYLNGPKFDSTLTNSNGVYSFGQLPQGTYIISEELRQGWKPTAPAFPGTYSLFVINGTDTSGLNFGNFELGIISGVKYNDLNGNGTRDFFDLPIRNWKIRLSGASSETTFTDSNGIYIFKNLNVGSYNVSEFSDSLWYQTSTPQSYSVTIASSGQRADNRNFGNFKYGRISGIVFGDENANGIRDPNELPLAGWKIYSSQGNRDSAISDAAGRYIFVRLRSGLDTLVAVPQDGYQQTYPDSTSGYLHIVQITSGFNGTDFHFGQKFIVSVKEEITGVPRIFQLFQNYPNPFNPSTAIKFSVDVASPTTLKLYNILGSEVAVLFNMIAEPGRYYTIQFNNENLNSGVYFYRLENGKKSSMRKLVIMK